MQIIIKWMSTKQRKQSNLDKPFYAVFIYYHGTRQYYYMSMSTISVSVSTMMFVVVSSSFVRRWDGKRVLSLFIDENEEEKINDRMNEWINNLDWTELNRIKLNCWRVIMFIQTIVELMNRVKDKTEPEQEQYWRILFIIRNKQTNKNL